jgi:hypothetical protein
MGLFKTYKTDTKLEKKGVAYTPDASTIITLARAGGANVKFGKLLDAKAKPFRRQIEAGTLDPELDRKMMAETYAEAVILNWETLDEDGVPHQVIEADPDLADSYEGSIDAMGCVPFNKNNVVVTLLALPDMFMDIQRNASQASTYQAAQRDADAGN